MSLAESIPNEFRAGFAERSIQLGTVIRAFVSDTNPPKEKRLILVGISFDKLHFASIFINSEINRNVFNTEELVNLNYEMAADDCDFLDHDSFADCSKFKSRSIDWLHDLVTADPSRVLGTVSAKDLQEIRNRIKLAPTINKNTKRSFGLSL